MNRLPLVLEFSILWGRKGETFLGSVSPPLHRCQTKCLTSAILQHMFDVNIMSPCLALTEKLLGKKKVAKMFWFLACPCSFLPALIFFSDFHETNVEYLRKVRMLCGFCRKCSKLVTFAGCGTGVRSRRSTAATAWCHHSYSPSREARSDPVNFLQTSTGCPWRP